MGRYLSPILDTSLNALPDRLTQDEALIASLQATQTALNTKVVTNTQQITSLQNLVSTISNSSSYQYKNSTPILNTVVSNNVSSGRSYNTSTSSFKSPTDGVIVNVLTFSSSNCYDITESLYVNGSIPVNGIRKGYGGSIWDFRVVGANVTVSSYGGALVNSTCGVTNMDVTQTLFTFFIPTTE